MFLSRKKEVSWVSIKQKPININIIGNSFLTTDGRETWSDVSLPKPLELGYTKHEPSSSALPGASP